MQQYDMPVVEALPYVLAGGIAMMLVVIVGLVIFKWLIRDREK